MKVLVISHNVFSMTESMGKTLSAYFNGFKPSDLAQFYVHSQVPTSHVCYRYYRVTDKEAIKSIFGIRVGTTFGIDNIDSGRNDARTDKGVTALLYQKARKRSPFIYLVRNTWWRLSHWNSKKLNAWLDDFQPDCVFFASGDYTFMYGIARSIASSRRIPLYVSCMDDYYFYNKNGTSFLGRVQHRLFMKSVCTTMDYASAIFCICDKMSDDYSRLFQKKTYTVHTPSEISKPLKEKKKLKISYLGNLGYQRNRQLIDIGKALRELNLQPDHIDVYSMEVREEILADMIPENGIVFHGPVGAAEVRKIIGESLAVIHTESFDGSIRQSVAYSVSTKIADSLASGTCIFAYGPKEIASIKYLEENKAAICCTDKNELQTKLRCLISDRQLREQVQENAVHLAKRNHSNDAAPQTIKKILCGN